MALSPNPAFMPEKISLNVSKVDREPIDTNIGFLNYWIPRLSGEFISCISFLYASHQFSKILPHGEVVFLSIRRNEMISIVDNNIRSKSVWSVVLYDGDMIYHLSSHFKLKKAIKEAFTQISNKYKHETLIILDKKSVWGETARNVSILHTHNKITVDTLIKPTVKEIDLSFKEINQLLNSEDIEEEKEKIKKNKFIEDIIPHMNSRIYSGKTFLQNKRLFENLSVVINDKSKESYYDNYSSIDIYTDGSFHFAQKQAICSAIESRTGNIVASHIIYDDKDFNSTQAEACGVILAIQSFVKSYYRYSRWIKEVNIYTDSQKVKYLIDNHSMGNHSEDKYINLLYSCLDDLLSTMSKSFKLNIIKVKGHSGILGNETADSACKILLRANQLGDSNKLKQKKLVNLSQRYMEEKDINAGRCA